MTQRTSDSRAAYRGCSIRLVAKRTGIAAETLRVWERRYGFPKPERRPGGSRAYSEPEVARLKLLARALDAGFRAGEVVPLPDEDVRRLLDATEPAKAPPPATTLGVDTSVNRVVAALLADDVAAVRSLLRTAAATLGPSHFVTQLAQPLAVRVGELWEAGALEIRHEHLASACLSTQLRLMLGAYDDHGARGPVVVLATLPGEPHELPLDMVAVYLSARHASPRLLGADTPPEQISAAARGMQAQAVGLSISPVAERSAVEAQVRRLAAGLPSATALWLGGAGAQGIAPDLPRVVHVSSWADLDATLDAARAGHAA